MKQKTIKNTIFVVLLGFLVYGNITAQTFDRNVVDGKLYVKLKENAEKITSAKAEINLNNVYFVKGKIKKYAISNVKQAFYKIDDEKLKLTYIINFNKFKNINKLIKELENDPNVEYVEKLPIFYTSSTKSIPNDEFYTNLDNSWYLKQIKAEQAWDITTGSPDIIVAVIDDAVQITHPDLVNKIHSSTDVANGDDDPTPPDVNTFSHGTHCAGLIAAETNNNIGIASIGYNIKLMAIKAAKDNNPDGISNGYDGIIYAADNGANVLSLSWGGPNYSEVAQNIINYAYNKGCIIVAAAGNEGNEGNLKSYPACYEHVISVGALNVSNFLATFSQYGDDKVDVCAPGGTNTEGSGLLSTVPYYSSDYDGNYDTKSGTSMATPVTAGLCGLMLSVDPNLTPEKLEDILFASCDDVSVFNPSKGTGHGRINAYEAVKAAQEAIEAIYADFQANAIRVYAESSIQFADFSSPEATNWAWTFEGGTPETSTEQNPKVQYLFAGKYKVTLTITDDTKSSSTETKTNFITVLEKGFGTEQVTGFAASSRGIDKISIADANTVWALALDGNNPDDAIFDYTRTIDGGENWQAATFPASGDVQFADVFALDANTAWIALFDKSSMVGGAIYKTEDGGQNWADQTTASYIGSDAFTNTVYFFDENNGWSMGDPNDGYFEIYTTNDGGTTWTRVPQENIPNNDFEEYGTVGLRDGFGESTAWFSTNKGRVFKTTDKGLTWTAYSTGLPSLQAISFADADNGVVQHIDYDAVAQRYNAIKISYTSDGGETWSTPINSTKGFYTQTEAVEGNPGVLISIGSDFNKRSGSSYSVDYGEIWSKIDDTQYTDVEFYNQDIGWAGSFNESETVGGIFKWSRIFTGIKNVAEGKKAGIFPNPTSGFVNIHAKTSFKGKISTQVYNITGKLIFSKKEMNYSDGVFVTNLDLSNIEKGVYFTVIKAGSDIFRNKIIVQ